MTKKKEEAKEKEEVLEEVLEKETPFDNVDYSQLATIKHSPGLYLIVSQPNQSDLVGVREWKHILTPGVSSKTVYRQNIQPLMENIYYTEDKEVVSIQDVFNNLYNYEETLKDDLGIEDLDFNDSDTVTNLMEIAIPNHTDEFKDYHLRKLVKYYTWTKESIANLIDYQDE